MIRRNCELGKNIALYRKRSGLTQSQLAEKLTLCTSFPDGSAASSAFQPPSSRTCATFSESAATTFIRILSR